jgi:3-oxoacyl-[acyl-carrier protein] reductase
VALITGVGRQRGIGAAISTGLADDGWDVAFAYWSPYDARMPWGEDEDGPRAIAEHIGAAGGRPLPIAADLSLPDAPAQVVQAASDGLGPVSALVIAHCESVDSDTLTTTEESFNRHYAVNVRATWLLIREFARRFTPRPAGGRVVTLTSDHVIGNLPYGATKAAADRITLAAAHDLAGLGITANAVNPGPIDTGWMDDEVRAHVAARTPLGRPGTTVDAANLVRFLCSPEGGWVNGQRLTSNGGFSSNIA